MRVFQTLLAFSGNAQPQLAVTRELVRRGHEVRVLAHEAARERIESTGAKFAAFERTSPALDITRERSDTLRDWQARTRMGAGRRLLENGLFAFVLDTARDCAAALEAHPADVVAYDWMLTGAGVAAEGAGLPTVALVHCPYPLPVAGAPPLFSGLRAMNGPLGAARDRVANLAAERLLNLGLALLNKARREQRLPRLDAWSQQLLRADEVCMLTAPELDFSSGGALPENVRYVGPAFEPYARDWQPPWPADNKDPLIVLSFSTSYMNQRALAQRALDAVDGLAVRALLTTGPALAAEPLRLAANTRAVAFVAHRSVLPQAALVVTHTGWQTVNAALADGVPLLCVPDGRDQPDNAARVLACGAGARIGKRASPRKLRAAIANALADSGLREGARKMALALGRSDGATAVADRLERLARDGAVDQATPAPRPGESASPAAPR